MVNPHGTAARGGEVLVDAQLNPPGSALTVILNTAEAAGLAAGPAVGTRLPGAPPAERRGVRLHRAARRRARQWC